MIALILNMCSGTSYITAKKEYLMATGCLMSSSGYKFFHEINRKGPEHHN